MRAEFIFSFHSWKKVPFKAGVDALFFSVFLGLYADHPPLAVGVQEVGKAATNSSG